MQEHKNLRQYQDNVAAEARKWAPITTQDLVELGCDDYESAMKVFGGKGKREGVGHATVEFMDYVAKDLIAIPLELRDGPRVLRLHMGYNQLARIDVSFFKMPVIRELNLDQNELDQVSAEFRYLTSLQVLSIKNNKIENISYHLCSLSNLRELSLSHNKIKALPSFFGSLHQMTHVWLSNNLIEQLPADEMIKLFEFDPKTGERYVRFSPGIGGLTSLQELWLDNNRIVDIPGEIGRCRSLKYLNMRSNKIVALPPEICKCQNLQCMVLTHNFLTEIPECVAKIPHLHTLQLEHNKIEHITDVIVDATTLTDLNVSHNPLKSFPNVISMMPHLVTFTCQNAVHDNRGVVISASWSRQHAQSDSFGKIIHEESGSASVPNRVFVYRSKNLPPTTCGRLYNQYYQPHNIRALNSADNSRHGTAGSGDEGRAQRTQADTDRLVVGTAAGSRPASGASFGGRPATGASSGSGGFRGVSVGVGGGGSSGTSSRAGETEGAGGLRPATGARLPRPKRDALNPASGALLMPSEIAKLGEFKSHSQNLMRERARLRSTRVLTPLLRDSLLIDEDEAQRRLTDGESSYAAAKKLYDRPSSSASMFRPVEFWDGDTESRPMTLMAPGARLPDRYAVAYTPPPTSVRPPTAPFSTARPNTGMRSSRGFDQL